MIQIQPIQPHQIEAARQVIATVSHELFARGPTTPEAVERLLRHWDKLDALQDMDDIAAYYFNHRGLFLVVLDGDRVVGTGAIRRLEEEIAELKRMWLLKEYRGQGWGRRLAERLLLFARHTGYQKVRLDLYDPDRQEQALSFYQRLGFSFIDPYNDGGCAVFMEKVL